MSRHLRSAVPHAVGMTAVAGRVVTAGAQAATGVVPVPRIPLARPANSVRRVLLRGYPVPGVTWRDPSPFT